MADRHRCARIPRRRHMCTDVLCLQCAEHVMLLWRCKGGRRPVVAATRHYTGQRLTEEAQRAVAGRRMRPRRANVRRSRSACVDPARCMAAVHPAKCPASAPGAVAAPMAPRDARICAANTLTLKNASASASRRRLHLARRHARGNARGGANQRARPASTHVYARTPSGAAAPWWPAVRRGPP